MKNQRFLHLDKTIMSLMKTEHYRLSGHLIVSLREYLRYVSHTIQSSCLYFTKFIEESYNFISRLICINCKQSAGILMMDDSAFYVHDTLLVTAVALKIISVYNVCQEVVEEPTFGALCPRIKKKSDELECKLKWLPIYVLRLQRQLEQFLTQFSAGYSISKQCNDTVRCKQYSETYALQCENYVKQNKIVCEFLSLCAADLNEIEHMVDRRSKSEVQFFDALACTVGVACAGGLLYSVMRPEATLTSVCNSIIWAATLGSSVLILQVPSVRVKNIVNKLCSAHRRYHSFVGKVTKDAIMAEEIKSCNAMQLIGSTA